MSYNFKPFNDEISKCCARQDYCTTCPSRVGCIMRYDFYKSNEKFDQNLRLGNSIYTAKLATIDALEVEKFNDWMREKRKREMIEHPEFSYN